MDTHTKELAGGESQYVALPTLDLVRLLKVILSRWYWLLASILFSVICGWIFLKAVKPKYVVESTLQYLDKKTVLEDLRSAGPGFIFSGGSDEFMAEKYKIISAEVIKNSLLSTQDFFHFVRIKDFRKVDTYPFVPLEIEILDFDEKAFDDGKFILSEDLVLMYECNGQEAILDYIDGKSVHVKGLTFQVKNVSTAKGYRFEFEYAATPERMKKIKEGLELKEVKEQISVMKLVFKHSNEYFANDFLRQLLMAYENYDLKDKQTSTDLTLGFIQDKLAELNDSLKMAAAALKMFRVGNQISDPESELLESGIHLRALEQEQRKLLLEKGFIDLLHQNVELIIAGNTDFLPLGWDDHADKILTGILQQYNQLIVKRKEILATQLPVSPEAKNNELHIAQTKQQLLENLRFQRFRNEQSSNLVNQQLQQQRSRHISLPAQAQDYQSLLGNYQINQQIYSLLINRQLEASLIKSGIIPSFKIIDIHKVEKIFPKKGQTMALFGIIGLLLGCLLVLAKRKRTNSFYRFEDLKQLRHIELGGIIPHFHENLSDKYSDVSILETDRSPFSEAFSTLRMHVFMESTSSKMIVITSTGAGDGKSFVGLNLAISFARMNKKVLLVGADMRLPSLDKYILKSNRNGLKEYLEDPSIDKSEMIQQNAIHGIDYVSAGRNRCFNSTELLLNGNFQDLLAWFRERYEIIILDTPPVGLITDALPLMQLADHIFYIIRWLHSDASAGQFANELLRKYKFKNMSLLINDFYHDGLYQSLDNQKSDVWIPGEYSRGDEGYYLKTKKRTSQLFSAIRSARSSQ